MNKDVKNDNDMDVSYHTYTKLEYLKNEDIEKYTHCVFLNATGAPWDVFGFLNTNDEHGISCVVQQVKLTNIEALKQMTIDQELFNKEHTKVTPPCHNRYYMHYLIFINVFLI